MRTVCIISNCNIQLANNGSTYTFQTHQDLIDMVNLYWKKSIRLFQDYFDNITAVDYLNAIDKLNKNKEKMLNALFNTAGNNKKIKITIIS